MLMPKCRRIKSGLPDDPKVRKVNKVVQRNDPQSFSESAFPAQDSSFFAIVFALISQANRLIEQ
jgi:hypothetical protein